MGTRRTGDGTGEATPAGQADGRAAEAAAQAEGRTGRGPAQAEGRVDGGAEGRMDGGAAQVEGCGVEGAAQAGGPTGEGAATGESPVEEGAVQAEGRADGEMAQAEGRTVARAESRAEEDAAQAGGRTDAGAAHADSRTHQGAADVDGPAGAARPGSVGKSRRPRTRRYFRRALVVLGLLLLPLLVAETALRLEYTGDPAPGTRTRNQDALWLGHAWVDGRKTDRDVAALARRLRGTGVRDLYVHSGPLEHDGTLPDSAYPRARWLIRAVHRELPGVRVQAWLGDKLATESPHGLHLERPATRTAIVTSTRHVLAAGFDGTHFDLEPLHSGDRDYLSLLDDLRAVTHARHALLSVAAHQIDPLPALHSLAGAVTGHPKWWSQAYFGQVARRVDQIAVMSYDTMQPLQSLYGGYVAQETSRALEVTPDTTDLLMGLPFFHENRFGHWAHAETVPAAVRGVRLGLSRTDAGRARFGVALYVDFAATDADWRAYAEHWVR